MWKQERLCWLQRYDKVAERVVDAACVVIIFATVLSHKPAVSEWGVEMMG